MSPIKPWEEDEPLVSVVDWFNLSGQHCRSQIQTAEAGMQPVVGALPSTLVCIPQSELQEVVGV